MHDIKIYFTKKALLHAYLPGVDQWHHHQSSWWEMGVMVALNATRMSTVYEQWPLSLPQYHYIRAMALEGACFTFPRWVFLSYILQVWVPQDAYSRFLSVLCFPQVSSLLWSLLKACFCLDVLFMICINSWLFYSSFSQYISIKAYSHLECYKYLGN